MQPEPSVCRDLFMHPSVHGDCVMICAFRVGSAGYRSSHDVTSECRGRTRSEVQDDSADALREDRACLLVAPRQSSGKGEVRAQEYIVRVHIFHVRPPCAVVPYPGALCVLAIF